MAQDGVKGTDQSPDERAPIGQVGMTNAVQAFRPASNVESVDEYTKVWSQLEDQSPYWLTDKGVDYYPAIHRWAQIIGRAAPAPMIPDGRGARFRLNPVFVEWMMGCPDGWISDPAIGLTRNQILRAAGNGVVTQQCLLALSMMNFGQVTA